MKITATTTGADAIKARMAALMAVRNIVGEVYWDGARNAKLGQIHAAGAPSAGIPSRNPFFTQPAIAARVLRLFVRGVDAIVAGRGQDFAPTMAQAADLVAKGMQRNLAPEGRLASKHAGLHVSAGTAVGAGQKMTPLSKPYAKDKEKRVGAKPILVRTGELWASIKSRVVTT